MPVSVCPAMTIDAPVERVWSLLVDTVGYGAWLDAAVERIEPPGPASAGQRACLVTRAFGLTWHVALHVIDVDPARHSIRFQTDLPLGVVGHNVISCAPLSKSACRAQFG